MTYDGEAEKLGRQPITIVEIDFDTCGNVYGTAPCTAVVGVNGPQKCFNTRKTCQDPANFNRQVRTYRFSDRVLPPGSGITCIPTITSVSMAPNKIDPGQSLGYRASVTVSFMDHPWHDVGAAGTDPYWRERTYKPDERGTYWGKLLARSPYYQNRIMRLRTGYLNQDGSFDAANLQTRTYVLDQIAGPDSSGKVMVTAKDVLKLAEDERAQCPPQSTGVLTVDIDNVVSTLTLSPPGIGDLEYPASGWAAMGEEVVKFTRVADVVTLVTRGTDNTTPDEHKTGETFQICKRWADTPVADVVYELLVTYGNIPTGFIDKTAWDAETLVWLPSFDLSVLLTTPTGVTTLLTELTQQALFYLWWDERVELLLLKALHPARDEDTFNLTDAKTNLAGSFRMTETPDDRISQVWVEYGLKNPTGKLDDPSNYRRVKIAADLAAETDEQYGEQRIHKVFARWLPTNSDGPAIVLAARVLARFRNNPRSVTVKLDAKDAQLWTGDAVRLSSRHIQDYTGGLAIADMQVLQVRETKPGTEYEYELADSFFQGRFAYVTPDDEPNYDDANDDQRRIYGFISRPDATFIDGTEAYKII